MMLADAHVHFRWGALVSVNAPMELLPLLAGVFDRLKDCTVLVSHLGLPGVISDLSRRELRQKTRPLRALARLPHVRVKASGFYACNAKLSTATNQAAGARMSDVVSCRVYLQELTAASFAEMNSVYSEYWPEKCPARTTVGAQLLNIDVEIDCVAQISTP